VALGAREVLLVIRARDEATRSLRFLSGNLRNLDKDAAAAASGMIARGTALFSLGAGLTAVGGAIAGALAQATTLAEEYDRLARMTLTQVDGVKIGLQELKDMAINVGRDIPVPLNELQGALYDIFSTIDVTAPEAQLLLEAFAKEAVTGQADIRRAAMTTIAILNAFGLPVSEITRLQDIQFQAVRKGAMTYEELSENIGKAIPASVQAGQEFSTLAGMMSFLTRGGLNVSMSATSAARALEAMSHPKTVERLEEMGVKVTDAQGNFLPLVDIFGQLNEKLEGLGQAERNKVIQELLAGGGNRIQARRFWIRALDDFDGLKQHLDWMVNSQGAFEEAYQTMLGAPVSKIQILKNNFEAMRLEIGERLLPVKVKLAEIALKLLEAWERLDPKTKDLLVKMAALSAVFLIIFGVITMIAGVFLLLSAAAAIVGVSLGAVVAIAAGVAAAIIGLVAVGYLIIANWETIKAKAAEIWEGIKQVIQNVAEWWNTNIVPIWQGAVDEFQRIWERFREGVTNAWNSIKEGIQSAIDSIKQGIDGFVEKIQPIKDSISEMADYISERWAYVLPGIQTFIENVAKVFEDLYNRVMPIIEWIGDALGTVFEAAGAYLGPIIEGIGSLIAGIWEAISEFVEFVVAIFTGDWQHAWESAQAGVQGLVDGVKGLLEGLKQGFTDAMDVLVAKVTEWWNSIYTTVVEKVTMIRDAVVQWFSELPGKAAEFFSQMVTNIANFLSELPAKAGEFLGQLVSTIIVFLAELPGKAIEYGSQFIAAMITWLGDMVTKAIEYGSQFITNTIRWLGELPGKASEFLKQMVANIVKFLQELPGKAQEWFSRMVETIKAWFGRGKDEAGRQASSLVTNVIDFVKQLPGRIGQAISGIVGVFRNKMNDAKDAFLRSLSSGAREAIREARNIPGKIAAAIVRMGWALYNAGTNIIRGLINGIKSMVSAVVTAARDVVRSAIDGAKRLLGLASPSKVFMEIGKNTMQGMVIGLESQKKYVDRAIDDIQGSVDRLDPSVTIPGQFARTYEMGGYRSDQTFANTPTATQEQAPVEVTVNVYTQEIDPAKHASDLAWELSRRMAVR
jgi:TP901 family phage tail tape measure protein